MKRKMFLVRPKILTVCFLCLLFQGCGSLKVDEENSPQLLEAKLEGVNEGSLDTQYVEIGLQFDRAVEANEKKKESLRLTIAGNRMKDKDIQFLPGQEENKLILRVHVTAVTNGVLFLGKANGEKTMEAFTTPGGKYPVKEFELEGMIPSGVSLSTVSGGAQGQDMVVKKVDTPWKIRSIAWIRLTEDGEPVPIPEGGACESMDGGIAVHGHDFLMDGVEEIAKQMEEKLSQCYGDTFEFAAEGDRITIHKKDGKETKALDLELYSYLRIQGE